MATGMATREVIKVSGVDKMLDLLWEHRVELDLKLSLESNKECRRISNAIQLHWREKTVSNLQWKTVETCVSKLTDGGITSWSSWITYLRMQRKNRAYKIGIIIGSIYAWIKEEVMLLESNPCKDAVKYDHYTKTYPQKGDMDGKPSKEKVENTFSKIIDDLPISKGIHLKDTLQDLSSQLDSLTLSPDEKNNTNLYDEMSIILYTMHAILDKVQKHQDADIRTGEDLLQGVIDLEKKIEDLESQIVQTEIMQNKQLEKLKTDSQQKDSKIESLMSEIKKSSDELLSKDGEITYLIEIHLQYVKQLHDEHEHSIKQIIKTNKKEIKALVKENKDMCNTHEATMSNLMNKHQEETSKRDHFMTEMIDKFSQLQENKERHSKQEMSISIKHKVGKK